MYFITGMTPPAVMDDHTHYPAFNVKKQTFQA
jgi:hypothetical protein